MFSIIACNENFHLYIPAIQKNLSSSSYKKERPSLQSFLCILLCFFSQNVFNFLIPTAFLCLCPLVLIYKAEYNVFLQLLTCFRYQSVFSNVDIVSLAVDVCFLRSDKELFRCLWADSEFRL